MSAFRAVAILVFAGCSAASLEAQPSPIGQPVPPVVTPAISGGFNPTRPPNGQFFNAGMPTTGFIPGGSGFAPGNSISFSGPRGTAVPFNYGGLSGGFGLPYSPYGMYSYSPPFYGAYYAPYYLPFTTPIGANDEIAPPIQGAGVPTASTSTTPTTSVTLTGMPAELVLQFPADAKVWLDGKEVAGTAAAMRELKSPILPPGSEYKFNVKAEWTKGGQKYEYERSLKVPAGDRSKIMVMTGTPKS